MGGLMEQYKGNSIKTGLRSESANLHQGI